MVQATEVRRILARHMLTDGFELVADFQKSKGSYLVDKISGDSYLDFFAMFASMAIGYNHPKLVAVKNILAENAIHKPANSDVYTEAMAEFVDTFSEIGIPRYLNHAFFIEGGALAVENTLKAAFDWKIRKNFAKGETEEKGSKIIHFRQAFHGRSGYTLSLTNTHDTRKIQYYPVFDWPRMDNPKITFPLSEKNLRTVSALEKKVIKQIKKVISEEEKEIAGIIIEPIQSEGGDNHFRAEFFKVLRDICDENDILLIFDEVQTGIGMTGKFWAYEHFGIQPDLLAFGKKMQVCGVLAGDRMDEVEHNVFHHGRRINSTFGGNLVDMVRATYLLKIIDEEDLVKNAEKQGRHLLKKIVQLADEFPKIISNPRGCGLMCAFDLPDEERRDRLRNELFKEKVLILGCADRSIRFRPHLTVTAREINQGIAAIKKIVENKL